MRNAARQGGHRSADLQVRLAHVHGARPINTEWFGHCLTTT